MSLEPPIGPINVVKRELLVRQIGTWLPATLRRSRRATLAMAYGGPAGSAAEAGLRALSEYADLLRGCRLAVLVLAAPDDDLPVRLGAAQAVLPAEVSVHLVPGDIARLPVALKAAGAAGAPLLAYLDAGSGPAPSAGILAAVAAGRPAEVLLALGASARVGLAHRDALAEVGLSLVADVELVAEQPTEPELMVFGTSSGRRLDAFKDAMWAIGGPADVRYRDPGDPGGELMEILPGRYADALRRNILARLAAVGRSSVTELRQFTAAHTAFPAADVNRVLDALLAAGLVTRTPADGRLSGEVVIVAAGAGPAGAAGRSTV